jgi:hypothetical protein
MPIERVHTSNIYGHVQHLLITMICASWTHAHAQEHHASLLWSVRVLVHMLYEGYVFVRPILSEPPALCVLDARTHEPAARMPAMICTDTGARVCRSAYYSCTHASNMHLSYNNF